MANQNNGGWKWVEDRLALIFYGVVSGLVLNGIAMFYGITKGWLEPVLYILLGVFVPLALIAIVVGILYWRKKPWYMSLWDATQYILNETSYGSAFQKEAHVSISWELKVQATAPKYGKIIRVWGRPALDANHQLVPVRRLVGATFLVQDQHDGGTIRFQDGEEWKSPRFNRAEVEAAFKDRPRD